MAYLKMTAMAAATLLGARTMDNDTASAVRKGVWAAMRDSFSIPKSVKLKAEIDDTDSDDYLVLKDKGSDSPLLATSVGQFLAVKQTDVQDYGPAVAPVTHASTSARFVISDVDSGYELFKIGRTELLELLRGDEYSVPVDITPAGLSLPNSESIALDASNGDLYFQAES